MLAYTTLVTYRDDTQTKDAGDIIPIDSEEMVIGLQAHNVKPVSVKTDGKKLIYYFVEQEVLEPFQKIQSSIAGVFPGPMLVDYNLILMARLGWKGLLTMMRTVRMKQSPS